MALILFPILLALLASEPAWRTAAAVLGGAALMLLVIFLLAVRHRRNLRRQFFHDAPNRLIRIVIDIDGIAVMSSLGDSRFPWQTIERVWRCRDVVLIFYHGWQYIAAPGQAIPDGALEYAEARIRERVKAPGVSG